MTLRFNIFLGIPPDGPFHASKRLTSMPGQDILRSTTLSEAVLADMLIGEIMALGARGHTRIGAEAFQNGADYSAFTSCTVA